MGYFAVALARTADGWAAHEVDLDAAHDVDELTELLRDVADTARTTLLFVEQDDEYVAIVRLDTEADEPRVFISDARATDSYPIVGMLADAVTVVDVDADSGDPDDDDEDPEEDDDAPPGHDSEPLGDVKLLADLGTPARDLLALCAHEGTLPADVITEVCERAGCLDELEALRLGA